MPNMTRVVPSQAVATIEQLFPGSRLDTGQRTYRFGQAGALRGIVDLVKQIPQELLIMPVEQYADFVIALGAIEQYLLPWASREAGAYKSIALRDLNGHDPVVLICRALLKCPDEYPPPSTADLNFISDQALRDSIRSDVGAANQALHNGEWKAATVLAGAAIEALLHWKLGQSPLTPAALTNAGSAVVTKKKLTKKPQTDLDHCKLQEFIEIAGELGVIKPNTVAAATLARDFRNLIHPGAVARR
jgi:hypothetical protein